MRSGTGSVVAAHALSEDACSTKASRSAFDLPAAPGSGSCLPDDGRASSSLAGVDRSPAFVLWTNALRAGSAYVLAADRARFLTPRYVGGRGPHRLAVDGRIPRSHLRRGSSTREGAVACDRVGREIAIERVQDVTYHQRILERIFGAGSLVIESGGDRGAEPPLPDIRHPGTACRRLINEAIEDQCRQRPSSASSSSDGTRIHRPDQRARSRTCIDEGCSPTRSSTRKRPSCSNACGAPATARASTRSRGSACRWHGRFRFGRCSVR